MTAASLLGLVRSVENLPRACNDLSEFLALRRCRAAVPPESLLGLWIDLYWVEHIPSELLWRQPNGESQTAYVRETAGVDGIWMLCWLEVPAVEPSSIRHALLASLAAAPGDPPRAFVPVFPLDAPTHEVQAEMKCLTAAHADFVLAPVYQDACSGRLQATALPSVRGPSSACGR